VDFKEVAKFNCKEILWQVLQTSMCMFVYVCLCVCVCVCVCHVQIYRHVVSKRRLRWSSGSVLTSGTQVRGFAPGRSRRIFKGEKIRSTPSFGGEVKPSVPCRRFAACKRSLELRESRILDEICRNISRPRRVPPSAARGLSRRWT
jgi:hypothetical protein